MGPSAKVEFVSERKEYALKIDQALEMPLGLEYVVTLTAGDTEFEACVPAGNIVEPAVDGGQGSVYGEFVGHRGAEKVVVFPATSLGTSIWYIPPEMMDVIAEEAG